MTKARDLANASTALSAVSATELGYVDGVTSAIQTQIDGKQAINANVSTTELGYLDGVTSAVQTQLDAKTAKATLTTTGDIYYASAANTPARLGIGSSAQVLTVAGGIPSWATAATPSSGATLISRTAFSASSGVTVDSLFSNTYENYLVAIQAYHSVGNVQLRLQGRAGGVTQTGSYYSYGFTGRNASSATTVGFQNNAGAQIVLGQMSTIGSGNVANLQFYRASASERFYVTGNLITAYDSEFLSGGGFDAIDATWDGLYLFPASGTITGQITVYGLAKS